MNRFEVDKNRCKACRLCCDVCVRKLLGLAADLNDKGYHPVAIREQSQCIACGLCALVCPESAITIFKEK